MTIVRKNLNTGIRYILIGLYCILEKFEDCEKLYNKFNDESAFMLVDKKVKICYNIYVKSKRLVYKLFL